MVVPGRGKRVLVVLVGFCVLSLFVVNLIDNEGLSYNYQEPLLADLNVYCNHPDSRLTGAEGRLSSKNFELVGTTIFIRHGERTPMGTENLSWNECNTGSVVNQLISRYWSCLHPVAISLLRGLARDNKKCQSAQLTLNGVAQHKKLGKFFKYRYGSLFGRDTEIISTQYSRTIMSLLSFLTEFKPNWCQSEKPQFNLTATTHNYHFSKTTCDAVDLLINKAPKIDNSTWTIDLAYIKNLFENKNSNADDWDGRKNPETIADFIRAKYCPSKRLPKLCMADHGMSEQRDTCVTMADYENFFSTYNSQFSSRAHEVNYLRSRYLAAYPMLIDYVLRPTTDTRLKILSGHDIDLEAVLTTLGNIQDVHVPYASRLVIETWKRPKNPTRFYRILLNGQVLVIPHIPTAEPNTNVANLKLLQHAEFEDYMSNVQQTLFSHKDAFSPEVYSNLCSQTYTEQLLEM